MSHSTPKVSVIGCACFRGALMALIICAKVLPLISLPLIFSRTTPGRTHCGMPSTLSRSTRVTSTMTSCGGPFVREAAGGRVACRAIPRRGDVHVCDSRRGDADSPRRSASIGGFSGDALEQTKQNDAIVPPRRIIILQHQIIERPVWDFMFMWVSATKSKSLAKTSARVTSPSSS